MPEIQGTRIGYLRDSNLTKTANIIADELSTLKKANEFLEKEVNACNRYESALRLQLKKTSHLRDNLDVATKYLRTIRKLFDSLNIIFSTILQEKMKQPSEIDVKKNQDNVEIANSLQISITALVEKTKNILTQLLISESHELYAQEDNRKAMIEISNDAKLILEEVTMISIQNKSFSSTISEFRNWISIITQEREKISGRKSTT